MIQLFSFCIILLLNLHEIQTFMQHGYEIKDLYETDIDLFQKEAAFWQLTPLLSEATRVSIINLTHDAESKLILGGPDIFYPVFSGSDAVNNFHQFQRVYTGLPPHNHITLVGKFWYFGDPSDMVSSAFSIYAEYPSGSPLEPANLVLDPPLKKSNVTEGRVYFGYIKRGFRHSDETLVLSILISTGSPRKISIGFRDITLHISNYSGNKMSEDFYCHVSEEQLNLLNTQPCKCPLNQGQNSSFLCQDCSENCVSCYGAKPSQCLACGPRGRWNGKECSKCHWNCQSCTGPTKNECSVCNLGYYNYGNGSCLETCDWPYQIEFVGNEGKCMKPCKPGQFLLKHMNKCVDKCQPPMLRSTIENKVSICENPCAGTAKFLYWNGTCILSCVQPLVHVDNISGSFCQNPCEEASKYLYFNRSCLDSCPAPYQAKSDPGVNYCKHPCLNPQYYVYKNDSCHASCPSPFRVEVESGVKSCLPPCDTEREYILNDGSCSGECPAPLIQRIKPRVGRYCLSPCESDDYFVTGNGSCLSNCPSFFDIKVKYGLKYCLSPCLGDQYYFEQNKSCLEKCQFPLRVRSEEEANLCENPCSEANSFLYDDQSCHKNCPAPLIIEKDGEGVFGGKYCKSPCEGENKYLNVDGGCQEKCEYPYKVVRQGSYQLCLIDLGASQMHQARKIRQIASVSKRVSEIGGIFSCLINAGDPTSLFMMPLLKMPEIIKYMQIVLPGNIELSLDTERNEENKRLLTNSSARKIEDHLQNVFDEQLRKIGAISLITFLLSGVLRVIAPIFNRSKSFKLLQEWSLTLQWNLLAPVLISSVGDIILYSIRASSHSEIRFLISLFGLLPLMIFLVYKIMSIGLEVKENSETNPIHLQKWRFAFEIYKSDKLHQRLFVSIYLVRVVLVSIVIGCLEEYPLLQAILLASMSFGMIFYLFCASPIQRKISQIQHAIAEIALLSYNTFLVILAMEENFDSDMKNALGQLMTMLFLTTPLLTMIIIVLKLLKQLYKKIWGSNIGSSSGFIQLSEISREEDEERAEEEESVEESHLMIGRANENEDSEEAAVSV